MRRVEAARVMVEARSSGEFGGEWGSVLLGAPIFFFVCVRVSERKRKGRNGGRERAGGEQERLFSFGIWILGHTGPGVSQSGQSEGGGWAGGPGRAD